MNMNWFALVTFLVHAQVALAGPMLVTLEGTTGAGKSTLLKFIQKALDGVQIVPEPVGECQDVEGTGNLLDLYYHDAARWSFLFQTNAFLLQDEANFRAAQRTSKKIIIGDRSIYATYYVFGKMLKQRKVFTPLEWCLYNRRFNYDERRASMRPHAFIYVRTTPDVCFLRIKKRNRAEEQEALLDYYIQEFYFHEKWLVDKEEIDHEWLKDRPVLILDGNIDFLRDEEQRDIMIEKIKNFITSLAN